MQSNVNILPPPTPANLLISIKKYHGTAVIFYSYALHSGGYSERGGGGE